jgi:hypothetical protein
MTVTQVGQAYLTGKPTIWCVWFEGTTKLDGDFPPEALDKA